MPVVPAADRFDGSHDGYFFNEVALSGCQVFKIAETVVWTQHAYTYDSSSTVQNLNI